MIIKTLSKWFSGNDKCTGAGRPKARLELESLEARECMSWTSVPSVLPFSSSVNATFNSNARSGTAVISNNEVDVYNFVAPRTRTYTLTAGKNFSRVDTVAGVFNYSSGTRIAGNDDSNGTTDSSFTAYLKAGTRYAFAVTNYTGTSTGGYKWSIKGPPLNVSVTNYVSSTIWTNGDALLDGNTLSVSVGGFNTSTWNTHTHRVSVYLLDANNRAIYSGSLSASVRTAGYLVSGAPRVDFYTATFDLSNLDLRNLRGMRIVAS